MTVSTSPSVSASTPARSSTAVAGGYQANRPDLPATGSSTRWNELAGPLPRPPRARRRGGDGDLGPGAGRPRRPGGGGRPEPGHGGRPCGRASRGAAGHARPSRGAPGRGRLRRAHHVRRRRGTGCGSPTRQSSVRRVLGAAAAVLALWWNVSEDPGPFFDALRDRVRHRPLRRSASARTTTPASSRWAASRRSAATSVRWQWTVPSSTGCRPSRPARCWPSSARAPPSGSGAIEAVARRFFPERRGDRVVHHAALGRGPVTRRLPDRHRIPGARRYGDDRAGHRRPQPREASLGPASGRGPAHRRPGPRGDLRRPRLDGRRERPRGDRPLLRQRRHGGRGPLAGGRRRPPSSTTTPAALDAVRTNLAAVGLEGEVGDGAARRAARPGWSARRPFDIAFCDPPYSFDGWDTLLGWLQADLAVLESADEIAVPSGWEVTRSRRYGGTLVTVVRQAPSPSVIGS